MAKVLIDLGTPGQPTTGDTLPEGGEKLNNFINDVYDTFGWKGSVPEDATLHATGIYQSVSYENVTPIDYYFEYYANAGDMLVVDMEGEVHIILPEDFTCVATQVKVISLDFQGLQTVKVYAPLGQLVNGVEFVTLVPGTQYQFITNMNYAVDGLWSQRIIDGTDTAANENQTQYKVKQNQYTHSGSIRIPKHLALSGEGNCHVDEGPTIYNTYSYKFKFLHNGWHIIHDIVPEMSLTYESPFYYEPAQYPMESVIFNSSIDEDDVILSFRASSNVNLSFPVDTCVHDMSYPNNRFKYNKTVWYVDDSLNIKYYQNGIQVFDNSIIADSIKDFTVTRDTTSPILIGAVREISGVNSVVLYIDNVWEQLYTDEVNSIIKKVLFNDQNLLGVFAVDSLNNGINIYEFAPTAAINNLVSRGGGVWDVQYVINDIISVCYGNNNDIYVCLQFTQVDAPDTYKTFVFYGDPSQGGAEISSLSDIKVNVIKYYNNKIYFGCEYTSGPTAVFSLETGLSAQPLKDMGPLVGSVIDLAFTKDLIDDVQYTIVYALGLFDTGAGDAMVISVDDHNQNEYWSYEAGAMQFDGITPKKLISNSTMGQLIAIGDFVSAGYDSNILYSTGDSWEANILETSDITSCVYANTIESPV